MYPVSEICTIVGGSFLQKTTDTVIQHLIYDSRRLQQPSSSVFFALITEHSNGHQYIMDAWKKGIRSFIVSEQAYILEEANFILVKDTLIALQLLAAHHRAQFNLPVIGITGSNGKTIVKEWLHQLLHQDFNIVRSPRSFNSQVGVPVSCWQISQYHNLGIFEAGISKPGEMQKLAEIIRPTIGILTNIGEAHNEGFKSMKEKEQEKSLLFQQCEVVISPGDDIEVVAEMSRNVFERSGTKPFFHFSWGYKSFNHFQILEVIKSAEETFIKASVASRPFSITIPFIDDASIENAITCSCVMMAMGYDERQVNERLAILHSIDMRLQLKHSFNECIVINDSYSADLTSLKTALDFLKQQSSGLGKTVILSEFIESGRSDKELYGEIAQLLTLYGISRVVVVGEKIIEGLRDVLPENISFHPYTSPEDFISNFRSSLFYREIILVKGARKFGFERIARLFEEKKHQTVLEINLNALVHNLKEYQGILQPGTKVIAMVKAFYYGSGGAEIASVLQFYNVDFLGVAYADEGMDLVRSGIRIPVMVMNAEESSFQSVVDNNLQPVIYSRELLHKFGVYLKEQGLTGYPVHIELDTGMNRLGFSFQEAEFVADHISKGNEFYVVSVFSHLAASESAAHDDYTNQQAKKFDDAVQMIKRHISYPFIEHIANSAAIVRHPHLQKHMVRLGIGLYGVEIDDAHKLSLHTVATLRSTIAQLRVVKKGETVSYNRLGIMQRDSLIATVRIGYADGYSRKFGNGVGRMLVRGKLVPVSGVVCMDMTMIDVTGVEGVEQGDDVIIFGPGLPVQQVAEWAQTIPYEIMTSISQRVKRVYFHE